MELKEAEDIFNKSIDMSLYFGMSPEAAEMDALDELLEKHNFDLAAALNMTREEIKVYFDENRNYTALPDNECFKLSDVPLENARQAVKKAVDQEIWKKYPCPADDPQS